MKDEELLDQVIKALECCTNQNCICNECPYLRKGCRHMKEDALKVLKGMVEGHKKTAPESG